MMAINVECGVEEGRKKTNYDFFPVLRAKYLPISWEFLSGNSQEIGLIFTSIVSVKAFLHHCKNAEIPLPNDEFFFAAVGKYTAEYFEETTQMTCLFPKEGHGLKALLEDSDFLRARPALQEIAIFAPEGTRAPEVFEKYAPDNFKVLHCYKYITSEVPGEFLKELFSKHEGHLPDNLNFRNQYRFHCYSGGVLRAIYRELLNYFYPEKVPPNIHFVSWGESTLEVLEKIKNGESSKI